MSTLLWWLIPFLAVLLGVAVTALVTYYRRQPEDHDLGQFASMKEVMNKSHGHSRRRSSRR